MFHSFLTIFLLYFFLFLFIYVCSMYVYVLNSEKRTHDNFHIQKEKQKATNVSDVSVVDDS